MSGPTLQTSVKVSVPLSSCYNEETENEKEFPQKRKSKEPREIVSLESVTEKIKRDPLLLVDRKRDQNLMGDDPEDLDFFVVDTHLTIDKPCIDLDDLWAILDDKLKLQAIDNMIDGSVDVIIGLN